MGNKAGRRNSKTRCRGGKRGSRVSVHPGRESQNDEKKARRAAAISLKHGISARVPGPQLVAGPAPPERNGPCPCKSGKKWKRCCGASGDQTVSDGATGGSGGYVELRGP